jgi:hypothetical protein
MVEPVKKATDPIIEFVEQVPLSYIVAALVVGALAGCALLILYDMHMSNMENAPQTQEEIPNE